MLATGDGRAVVDTGPEPEPSDRCLRRLRIRRIALLVASHLHADHAGGIRGVLTGRSVEMVVVGPGAAGDDAAGVLDAATGTGVVVREVGAGATLRAGDLDIRVLGPAGRRTGGSGNDNSLVLAVDTTVVGRVLLQGDAEEAALDALVRSGTDVRADVLKVPHHGSRTTPARFLTAVRLPSVALVSAGRDNLFGHPHPEIVSTLTGIGARVLRTDLHGDVAVLRAASGGARGGVGRAWHDRNRERRVPASDPR